MRSLPPCLVTCDSSGDVRQLPTNRPPRRSAGRNSATRPPASAPRLRSFAPLRALRKMGRFTTFCALIIGPLRKLYIAVLLRGPESGSAQNAAGLFYSFLLLALLRKTRHFTTFLHGKMTRALAVAPVASALHYGRGAAGSVLAGLPRGYIIPPASMTPASSRHTHRARGHTWRRVCGRHRNPAGRRGRRRCPQATGGRLMTAAR